MFTRTVVIVLLSGLLIGCAWLTIGTAGAPQKSPAPEALKNVGPSLAKAYTFEPFHPAMPDHLWLDAGNGRATFLHFNKPVSDSTAVLIFVGEGIKGRFCAEDQPDAGKTGYVHFHRSHTPEGEKGEAAHGHGGKQAEEGYWLRHVAIGEFDMMGTHFKPGIAINFMPTPAPKCGS